MKTYRVRDSPNLGRKLLVCGRTLQLNQLWSHAVSTQDRHLRMDKYSPPPSVFTSAVNCLISSSKFLYSVSSAFSFSAGISSRLAWFTTKNVVLPDLNPCVSSTRLWWVYAHRKSSERGLPSLRVRLGSSALPSLGLRPSSSRQHRQHQTDDSSATPRANDTRAKDVLARRCSYEMVNAVCTYPSHIFEYLVFRYRRVYRCMCGYMRDGRQSLKTPHPPCL